MIRLGYHCSEAVGCATHGASNVLSAGPSGRPAGLLAEPARYARFGYRVRERESGLRARWSISAQELMLSQNWPSDVFSAALSYFCVDICK